MAGRNGRTVRDLRRGNRTAVLQRLYFDGPLSRFELGPATGLSSGSVSNVVADLVADGLVEEAGSVDSDGGRPRTLLRVSPDSGQLIGVDVGETRVRIELFDLALTELARTERPLTPQGYDAEVIAGHIRDGVAEMLAAESAVPERLLGVGIGVPGIVEHTADRGAVVHGQTIGWDAVPLEQLLRSSSELPETVRYFIDNGAKTLGQAEMWFGAGRGARNAVVVLFGSGVGACLVTPEVERGRAVEWGHLTVRVRGRRCRCGAPGCLEAYAGAESLLARWREEGGRPPADADEETALTAMLAAAYPAGDGAADPVALAVLEETAEYLGAGLSDLINLFQPERIIVGGWAGLQLGTRFLPAVRRHATTYALRHPADKVSIELGRLGPDAVTVGAAILPLADFFAAGGHRPAPAPESPLPLWRTALRERAPGV
ncbi:ROK family transcriptional regulator [Streptomyces misionensis]|uniref:ROK family transcriptional regulator n=1 Tax=Streptomyces misionensis TaxID=67331 RepID=A0A5C6JXT9_9ACTN|nr:ROK family transcriptional regulator [Streptomyces misionensis]TWV55510.1 ROK family transcriptional regulator [Streptomyces misionensis]